MGSEQRRFDRVKASFKVAGRRAGALSETWRRVAAIDFSAGGLSFESEELFEAGEPMEFEIALPSLRMPLHLRAQMVRSEVLAPGRYGCAAEFVDVTPDQQAAIDELVQFLRKPPVS